MSVLESKINSIGSLAIETASRLNDNYYEASIETALTAGNSATSVSNLFFRYYKMTEVNNLQNNYQTRGKYLTRGSLIGYITSDSISTNYLASGSLVGYLTSGSLFAYVNTGSIPTNYLTGGSLINYVTSGSIPRNYLTSGSLIGYAQLTKPSFNSTITTNFLNMITPGDPNDVIRNNTFIPTASQLAAQLTLSGGGFVSGSGTHLKWGGRVYVSPVSKPEFATDGIYFIDGPLSGTVITRYTSAGTNSVKVRNDGIRLSAWDALYWFIPTRGVEASVALLNLFIVDKDATTCRHTGRIFCLR